MGCTLSQACERTPLGHAWFPAGLGDEWLSNSNPPGDTSSSREGPPQHAKLACGTPPRTGCRFPPWVPSATLIHSPPPSSAQPSIGCSSAGRLPPAPAPSGTAGAPLGRRLTKSERRRAKAARLDTDPGTPAAAPRGPLDPPAEVHLRRAWAADLVGRPAVYAQEHCSCPRPRGICPSPQLYLSGCLRALVSSCSPTRLVGA